MSTTPSPELLDSIRACLDELRLDAMKELLERELGEPSGEDFLTKLARMLEAQCRVKQERAIERRIKAAKFPALKTLEGFDFDFQKKLDRDSVMQLATLDWLRQRRSLLFGGMSGTGKSHIALALGQLACVAGFRTLYTTSACMLSRLHLALATDDLQRSLRPYLRCELLIIDEVGLDRPERRPGSDDAGLFYKVVAGRYEASRSCIITTNIQWDAWGEYLGDDIATAAILDRLVHHSYRITITGPSWRGHQHKLLNDARDPVEA